MNLDMRAIVTTEEDNDRTGWMRILSARVTLQLGEGG